MPTHSDLADRVLWDGEGAISSRRLLERVPSTIGNASVDDGDHDGEWSVAYMREESFVRMNQGRGRQDTNDANNNNNNNKRLWMARFRRHRIVTPKTPPRTPKQSKQQQLQGKPIAAARATSCPEQQSSEELRLLQRYQSTRTTRNQVDGKSLMVKQHAKVFNRDSHAKDHLSVVSASNDDDDDDSTVDGSIARAFQKAHLVRNVSSLSMGSHHVTSTQYRKNDWGDPFMKSHPLIVEEEEEEDVFRSFLETTQEEEESKDLQLEEYAGEPYYGDTIDAMQEILSIASDPGSLDYDGFFDDEDEPGSPNSVPGTTTLYPSLLGGPAIPIVRKQSTGIVKRKSSLLVMAKKETIAQLKRLSSSCEDICFVPEQMPNNKEEPKKSSVRAYVPPSALASHNDGDGIQTTTTTNKKTAATTIARPDRIERRAVTLNETTTATKPLDQRSMTLPPVTRIRPKRRPVEDVDEPPSCLKPPTRKMSINPSTRRAATSIRKSNNDSPSVASINSKEVPSRRTSDGSV